MVDKKDKRPIERYFPITEVNKIAKKESFAKRYYRPVYTMHKWWARRLGSVFRTILLYSLADENMKVMEDGQKSLSEEEWSGDPEELWDFYLKDVDFNGKTVLDPFFGGGTTIVEALRMGCNVIGSELNPVAWFVTKKEIEPVDLDKLDEAYNRLKENIAPEIKKYYKTTCPECGREADAMYYFWVKELECLNCGHKVPLFKSYRIASIRPQKVLEEKLDGAESGYWIYCPKCSNIFPVKDYKKEVTCPNCGFSFKPENGNASGRYYTCPECGQKEEIIKAIDRKGKPEEKMYAVEFYCPHCDEQDNPNLMNGKGYKLASEKDRELYEKAAREFKEKEEKLPIPGQEIPKGKETHPRLENHGYKKFRDMFNKRQFLNLGKLLKEIKSIDDKNIREYLTLAFSTSLDLNNMLCDYNRSYNKLENMFGFHAYIPGTQIPENSVWNDSKYGRGDFPSCFSNMVAGLEYKQSPYEKYIKGDETREEKMQLKIKGELVRKSDLLGQEGDTLLLCGDSSYLPIPDKSVDAVVTDPPYFDNVMYSELSDFFYVWLREVLKDEYEYFNSKLTPKSAEVVENPKQGKGEEEFTSSLTRVFSESFDKLKDDGIMVFTFHHSQTEAWASVLNSVLNAGFYVTAVYPINAELSESMHIRKKGNIEYDMIVICRKRKEEPQEKSWESIKDQIYLKAKDTIEDLESDGKKISKGDMFVVVMGKCLEGYSKYYPNVVKNDQRVEPQEALDKISEIVESQFMGSRFDEFEKELDTPSAVYLSFLVGRGDSIAYNTLNKELQQRGISVKDMVKEGLVKKEGSKVVILDLEERAEKIEKKRKPKLSAIDKAHYIQYLKKKDKLAGDVRKWADKKAVKALRELGEIKDKKKLKELAEYVDDKRGEKGLEEFE